MDGVKGTLTHTSISGLFGNLSGATIRNLGVDVNITVYCILQGTYHIGIIAGIAGEGSIIYNTFTSGDVSVHSDRGGGYAGGMIGMLVGGSTIQNSFSTANITLNRPTQGGMLIAGGIVGLLHGSVENVYATGAIRSTSIGVTNTHGGGIAGAHSPVHSPSIRSSVALNPRITDARVKGRVLAHAEATGLWNNHALRTMSSLGPGGSFEVMSFAHNRQGGAHVTMETALETPFWTETMGWSPDIWIIEDGALPTLRIFTGGTPVPGPGSNLPDANRNLSLDATMTSSSMFQNNQNNRPQNANDNNTTAWVWRPYSAGPEYLFARFDEPKNFNQIRIYQNGNRIRNYTLSYSNNGIEWTTIHSGDATPGFISTYSFSTVTAQYVRLDIGYSISNNPAAIFQFDIRYMP